MRILLVGGAVRNLLLGRPVADKDYLVLDADETTFCTEFPTARQVGKSFPVFLVDGVEYAFPRTSENPTGLADGGLADDLLARDLTVNAMAVDDEGQLHAHPHALEDLHKRVLRPCSSTAMSKDPLRVFRAARFAAQLPDFTPHPELLTAMKKLADSDALVALSPIRVGNEVLKALAAPRPSRFFEVLRDGGCLSHWLPELAAGVDIPAGPAQYHSRDVFGHTMEVADKLAGEPLEVWMAICHDLGKVGTPTDKLPHHYGHEHRGEEAARILGDRLSLPSRYRKAGMVAARQHMKAGAYHALRPGTRVDLLDRLRSAGLVLEMFSLVKADGGQDHKDDALADLKAMLSVRLPPDAQDKGAESGNRLRQLRAQALSKITRDL